MEGMHFPLKKWAVRAIQSHIDTHYIEMMSMNHTTNFNHIMQIALFFMPMMPLFGSRGGGTGSCWCRRVLTPDSWVFVTWESFVGVLFKFF